MRENQKEWERREKKTLHTELNDLVKYLWIEFLNMVCPIEFVEAHTKFCSNLLSIWISPKPSQARIWPQCIILHFWYYAQINGYVVVLFLSDRNAHTFICRKNFYILTEWHVAKFTWIFLNKVRNPIDSTTSIGFFFCSLCA